MSETQPPVPPATGSIGSLISQLFNPATITALRYALTAIGPLLATAGFAALSPDQISHVITLIQEVGTAVAAIAAFIGVITPLIAGIIGTWKSTQGQQVASVSAMPGVSRILVNDQATPKLAVTAVGIDDPKVQAEEGHEKQVEALAKQA